jgi:hypothetical protein
MERVTLDAVVAPSTAVSEQAIHPLRLSTEDAWNSPALSADPIIPSPKPQNPIAIIYIYIYIYILNK